MVNLTMDAGLTLLHWRLSKRHGASIGWWYVRPAGHFGMKLLSLLEKTPNVLTAI